MLKVYYTDSQESLTKFIHNTLSEWYNHKTGDGWAIIQADIDIKFPTDFVLVTDANIKVATIHTLCQ